MANPEELAIVERVLVDFIRESREAAAKIRQTAWGDLARLSLAERYESDALSALSIAAQLTGKIPTTSR